MWAIWNFSCYLVCILEFRSCCSTTTTAAAASGVWLWLCPCNSCLSSIHRLAALARKWKKRLLECRVEKDIPKTPPPPPPRPPLLCNTITTRSLLSIVVLHTSSWRWEAYSIHDRVIPDYQWYMACTWCRLLKLNGMLPVCPHVVGITSLWKRPVETWQKYASCTCLTGALYGLQAHIDRMVAGMLP